MSDLTVNYGGLKLKNPLVVASSGLTGSVDLLRRAEEEGAAAVVLKTLFEEEYTRRNPAPCFTLIRRKAGPLVSSTFYTFEQASPWGLERYAEEVRRAREALEIPVIASINCISDEGWESYARTLEEAGASALELNRSCPFSTVVLGTGDAWTELAVNTLKLVKKAVSIPVFPKFTPQLSNPTGAALALEKAGADGLVMFSRFTGLEIDLETEKPIMHGGFAGHGGAWSLHYALRWIAATSPEVSAPISASGGACSGDDVIKFILAGANNVQICTAAYMEGLPVLGKYLRELAEFMERKGYRSPEDFRGKVCSRILSPQEVDRSGEARVFIEAEECNGCGKCAEICLHDAIRPPAGNDVAYAIEESKCAGCGLCVQVQRCRALQWVGA